MLGFRLHEARVPIRFVPEARTIHRFPDTAAELVRLRLLRGADTVGVAPSLARSVLPGVLGEMGRVPLLAPLAILGARIAFSARAVGHQDMAPAHGLRRAACVAGVAGITVLDAAGAVLRTFGVTDLGVHDGALREGARLGYHKDGDRLREAA
jgi:hypothetical protein